MRILLIFTLLAFMTGCVSSFTVPGYSGGTVFIYCHYERGDIIDKKYFCMAPEYNMSQSCEVKIRASSQNTWQHRGRFSLYDDTERNLFTVVIRQLTREDEGIYWCGVDKPGVPDSYTKVEMEVKDDKCCNKSVTETVDLGGEANIICNYPEKHEESIKYFCKERNESDCEYKISTKHYITSGRYTLSKKRTERHYTVIIRGLTEDDGGIYWCGEEKEGSYIALIKLVNLLVRKGAPSLIAEYACLSPSHHPHNENKKPPPAPSKPSTSSPALSSSSTLTGPGTPGIILVCVCLVVFLLVVSLFIVYRWKHNKTTANSSGKRVNRDTEINREGFHAGGDYVEIDERPLQSERGNTTASIYTTIDFHKDPSCPNEATTTISKEDTSSCDCATVNVDQNSTYPTVNHPHSTSEAPSIYSTVSKQGDT
ncbi:polymeric immunoglobulin receptor isoform X2 [Esox lucius]|uniref:polymeric immunoglobulin receptor isoform X2 n=1 Tax=Esox lucius TaxID=8010 RepID=UPI001476CADE|nr:polymeric immunoglobulin receptor isoform X2 [Esox lucius]